MNFLLSAFNVSKQRNGGRERGDSGTGQAIPEEPAPPSPPATAPALKMQVLLRIRPASPVGAPAAEAKSQADVYVVDSPVSLLVRNASANDSATRRPKSGPDGAAAAFKKFSFDRIFDRQVDQARFFSEALEPRLVDLLSRDRSCSLVCYGSADAGKTYTLFGPSGNPGVIPRSIQCIFSSINCSASPRYKPAEHSQASVVGLDEIDRELEIEVRKKLMSCRAIDRAACDKAYSALQEGQTNYHGRPATDSTRASLWISFVEIYNDAVYDLLEVDGDGKNAPLKLSTDKRGSTYVQGMRSVCATSGLEAYEILNAGQTKLSTAVCSASNYKSSRSHSIFTVRLLKYAEDSTAASPAVQMSSISFYDLAGTGKLTKSTTTSSDDCKQSKVESRSINTSLLAFGRCLKALAEGHSRQSTGPFRDSKLTRLFQRSLRKEDLIVVINLNPSFELLAESQNVLNFASATMRLTSEFAKEDKRLQLDCQSPLSSPKLQEPRQTPSPAVVPRTLRDQDIQAIVTRNKQLLDQMKQLKAAELTRECKLRQDLADFYTKQLNDLEEIWKSRMSVAEEEKEHLVKFSVDRVESCYEYRLDDHLNHQRQGIAAADNESIENAADASSALCTHQDHSKVSQLERLLKSAKEENKQMSVQNAQLTFEVSWLKDNLKRITDFIGSTEEKYDDDLIINDLSSKSFQCFNNDTISQIQCIVGFVRDYYAKEQVVETLHCSSADLTLLDQHLKHIEALFHSDVISPLEIDGSSNLSTERVDQPTRDNGNSRVRDLMERLSRTKQSVAECLSDRHLLEAKVNEKEEELRLLRSKMEEQHMDLLDARQERAECESARSLLLRKRESLEMTFKSREFFKNPGFDVDDSENSLPCACHREIICSKETDDGCGYRQTSMLDSSSVNTAAESNATRSSWDSSSKDDSGVAFSVDSVVVVQQQATSIGEDKCCQTDNCHQWDGDQHEMLKDKLTQLNVDYNRMETQHLQGSRRITELSSELERIGEAMLQLKESTSLKDRTICECRSKLGESKAEIDRLSAEKRQLQSQFDELRENLLAVSKDYEKKLEDSQVQLRAREEGEYRATRCLKDYWQKSMYLGYKLSMAYSELEKLSSRCYREHVSKIHQLEDELGQKEAILAKLSEQMHAYEKDLAEMIVLSVKVDEFESTLSQLQKQKVDVDKAMTDRPETQLVIQNQLDMLTHKIVERDDQIMSLKWQLETIIKANLANSHKAKELGIQVTKLLEKMCTMKEDIDESETARTDLERKSAKEIDNLRARLTIFEGNADLLNVIRNSDAKSKQCEMDKLKLKVLEKEKELEFFKKNRNATIRRYECLVEQLQKLLKINGHPNRARKISFLKEMTCCHVHGRHDSQAARDWGARLKLEVRDQTKSVVHTSRRDTETVGANGSFESCIEEKEEICCSVKDFSGRQFDGHNC